MGKSLNQGGNNHAYRQPQVRQGRAGCPQAVRREILGIHRKILGQAWCAIGRQAGREACCKDCDQGCGKTSGQAGSEAGSEARCQGRQACCKDRQACCKDRDKERGSACSQGREG
ncbi:hypothetical protein [Cupriavidus oxalaticus]|uniref:hypothetical protein n=1 Tax=Cupriavidus oxalaticus TaxID=96344 RepID=UPI0012EDB0F4|nr:hypothetical protein [Cupriavidus oxalaticus]